MAPSSTLTLAGSSPSTSLLIAYWYLGFIVALSRLYFAFLIVTPLAVPQRAIRENYLHFGSISADILLSTNVISE